MAGLPGRIESSGSSARNMITYMSDAMRTAPGSRYADSLLVITGGAVGPNATFVFDLYGSGSIGSPDADRMTARLCGPVISPLHPG